MTKRDRKPPVEVAGFVNQFLLVKDEAKQTLDYRWFSVPHGNHADSDFEPYDEDWADRPPF